MKKEEFQKIKKSIYDSSRWQKLANYIRHKYFFICQKCKKPNSKEVHHIIPIDKTNYKDACIVYNENNLTLLCRACHNKIHDRHNDTIRDTATREITFDEEGNLLFIK